MNPEVLTLEPIVVVGIVGDTSAAEISADMQRQGEQVDAVNLHARVKHLVDPDTYLVALWNWSAEGRFPLMTAAQVSSADEQPADAHVRTLPAGRYARIPMEGREPNLVEPWPEIMDWYPLAPSAFNGVLRRYHLQDGWGELLVPLFPGFAPTDSA